MIPNGYFVANPASDIEARLEAELANLPQKLGSLIIFPTADDVLRRELDARGFFRKESSPMLTLMWRQFPDGALYTGT